MDRFKFRVWDIPNKCFLIERKQEFYKQFFNVYELDDKSAFSSLSWCLDKKEFVVMQTGRLPLQKPSKEQAAGEAKG